MEFVPNSRSNKCLVFNGYIFLRSKKNLNGSINWRCQNYHKTDSEQRCHITCTTLNGQFLRQPPSLHDDYKGRRIHDPPGKEKKLAMQFVDAVKSEVQKSTQPLKKLWDQTLNSYISKRDVDLTNFSKSCPPYENIRRQLAKIRRKEAAHYLNGKETIDLNEQCLITNNGSRFLLFDTKENDRMMAFASDRQLDILSKSSKWYINSVYKSAPELSGQLCLINAYNNDELQPCAFILLPNNEKPTYKKMLHLLKNSSQYSLKPERVMSEFEVNAINAFEEEFPGVDVKVSHYFMSEEIWRQIEELGLASEYLVNQNLRIWLDSFRSLALIPSDSVHFAFNFLVLSKPFSINNDKLDVFIDYFQSTWLNVSKVTVCLWNHHETYNLRTNNDVDDFNLKLKRFIESIQPSMFCFIDGLKVLESINSANYRNELNSLVLNR